MSDFNVTPEGAVLQLAEKLLQADGKVLQTKGTRAEAATKEEIITAYKVARKLVRTGE